MYRSKNKELMEGLKTSVLKVTKGMEREDRKFSLDYLRNHIKIDDLHRYALKHFPHRIIDFGSGSFNPQFVVMTKDPITQREKEKLEAAWKRLGLTDEDVFYTHLRFVRTKKKQQIRQEIIEKLIHILSPTMIILFDHLEPFSTRSEVFETGCNISVLTNKEDKEERKKLTRQLKKIVS